MDGILTWQPILWLSRILAVRGLGAATLIMAPLVARLLRPATWRAIFSGKLPRPKSLTAWGHKIEFLEEKVETDTELDAQRDQQLRALKRQTKAMALVLRKYGEHIDLHREVLEALLDTEDHDDEIDEVGGQEGVTEEGA